MTKLLSDRPEDHLRKISGLLEAGHIQLALLEAVRAVRVALPDFEPGGGIDNIDDGDVAGANHVLELFQERLEDEASG
jgi:hypothetical protein